MSALGAAVALVGRGRAMEAGGPSRMWVSRGSGNLGAALEKMGLPGSGVGARALGATAVVLGTLRLACLLKPELTPGMPGASAWMPDAAA